MTVFLQIYSRESRLPEPDLELQGKNFYVYQVNKYFLDYYCDYYLFISMNCDLLEIEIYLSIVA